MGNDDGAIHRDGLPQGPEEGLAWLLPDHLYDLADRWQLTGDPYVSLTPFSIKDWERFDHPQQRVPQPASPPCLSTPEGIRRTTYPELQARGTLQDRMAALAARTEPARTVFVFNDPPHGTSLDRLWNGVSVGSQAIRDFILEHQPPLTLHGHIHEAPARTGTWGEWLGSTLCVNPGQRGRRLHYVVFDTGDFSGTMRHSVYCPGPTLGP